MTLLNFTLAGSNAVLQPCRTQLGQKTLPNYLLFYSSTTFEKGFNYIPETCENKVEFMLLPAKKWLHINILRKVSH